jgi:multidrug efflux pump subunit AcrB
VTIVQPGAAPEEMENQITQRVEAALRGVEGVDEINSSINEGRSNTFVQFAIGTPTDRAVNDVREAIAQIRGELPRESSSRRFKELPSTTTILPSSPPKPPT